MKKNEILEKQVEALEKLLELKQAIIDELEAKINRLQNSYPPAITNIPYVGPSIPQQPIFIPSQWTVESCPCNPGGTHDYPSPWFGTTPPCCKHCGKQSPSYGTVSVSGAVGGAIGSGSCAAGGITTTSTSISFDDDASTLTRAAGTVTGLKK
jgi:hypothetical protein